MTPSPAQSGWTPTAAPTAAAAPAPAVAGALAAATPVAEPEPSPFAATGVPADQQVEDEGSDAEDVRPRHPYTVPHMLVLVLVAFVLGFLIFLLYAKAHPDDTTPQQPAGNAAVLSPTRGVL